jgi:hypothetical protein
VRLCPDVAPQAWDSSASKAVSQSNQFFLDSTQSQELQQDYIESDNTETTYMGESENKPQRVLALWGWSLKDLDSNVTII